jgi:AbrB family looped-hinge helix DNA binding protein
MSQRQPTPQEVAAMPLVKIKDKYQVTLPAEIRERLALKVGDVLEVALKDEDIVLKPKILIDKNSAWERLMTVLQKVHEQNKGIDPAQVERDVMEAIHKRRHRESKKSYAKRRAR